jgi:hypothetical protein
MGSCASSAVASGLEPVREAKYAVRAPKASLACTFFRALEERSCDLPEYITLRSCVRHCLLIFSPQVAVYCTDQGILEIAEKTHLSCNNHSSGKWVSGVFPVQAPLGPAGSEIGKVNDPPLALPPGTENTRRPPPAHHSRPDKTRTAIAALPRWTAIATSRVTPYSKVSHIRMSHL